MLFASLFLRGIVTKVTNMSFFHESFTQALAWVPRRTTKTTPRLWPRLSRRKRGEWWQSQEEQVIQGRQIEQLVLFDQATHQKLLKGVMTFKLITPFIVSARMKVWGSLAWKALRELLEKSLNKHVVAHNAQHIYPCLIKEDKEDGMIFLGFLIGWLILKFWVNVSNYCFVIDVMKCICIMKF